MWERERVAQNVATEAGHRSLQGGGDGRNAVLRRVGGRVMSAHVWRATLRFPGGQMACPVPQWRLKRSRMACIKALEDERGGGLGRDRAQPSPGGK